MLKLFEITLYNYMGGIIYMKEQLSAIKTSAESSDRRVRRREKGTGVSEKG